MPGIRNRKEDGNMGNGMLGKDALPKKDAMPMKEVSAKNDTSAKNGTSAKNDTSAMKDASKKKDASAMKQKVFPVTLVRDFMLRTAAANGSEKAAVLRSFFKSGPGQYSCEDRFYGVSVPQLRSFIAGSGIRALGEDEFYGLCHQLLLDSYHEMRMLALLAMVDRVKGKEGNISRMYKFYRDHIRCVNNWGLVDISAPAIVGMYALREGKEDILYAMAKSSFLWEQRVAVVSSWAFIKVGLSEPTFCIADSLMFHEHDLIQKAVGWMLRECGKRISEDELCMYLDSLLKGRPRYSLMPRTMLRYAIERLSKQEKDRYMHKTSKN